MIEEILKQIKEKKTELQALKASLNEETAKEYNFLIGKYYRLAASSHISITSIAYASDNTVCVNCIKIYGGKYSNGNLEIDLNDNYDINFDSISKLKEISKEEFVDFLNECLECSKKEVIELLH